MPPGSSRTVFGASDVSEEQIAGVFSEVGPVHNVEIKFDPVSGKSKGYAFVQYYDEATALSAVRNLQEVPINSRPVRIELSTDDGPRRGGPPRGGGGGGFGARPGGFGGRDSPPPRAPAGAAALSIPPGTDPLPGQKATDAISETLGRLQPGELQEVMAGMKTLITTQPDKARELLTSQPQLTYALFQAMLLLKVVDDSVLQRIVPGPPAAAAAAHAPPAAYPPFPAQPPPAAYPPFRPPPSAAYATPPPGYGYAAPPPQPAGPPPLPPAAQAELAKLPENERNTLIQVLQLTPEQIGALDPDQRNSVLALRQQFGVV
ncbi:Cleavage stimulation factor subunit 2 tau [Vanrija albida]|uniref:Cleavage stimulation factor subunit 2 tau n=1 Tax=Vanrija albida TaxID=181172 RepID=A0ABR3PUJ8_9TREE